MCYEVDNIVNQVSVFLFSPFLLSLLDTGFNQSSVILNEKIEVLHQTLRNFFLLAVSVPTIICQT